MDPLNLPTHSAIFHRRRRNRSGFTPLESVIALGVLAFGILAVAGALLSSIKTSRQSRSLTQAMNLAEQQVELFKAMPSAEVLAAVGVTSDPENPIDPDPDDSDITTFTRSWTIVNGAVEAGVISVDVNVTWIDELGVPRIVQLQTLKANQ